MDSYNFLLSLALILLFTKIFGLMTAHVHLPQVVGALLAGIIFGPSGVGLLHESDFLVKTAEIGVIMLMFIAGIDTDINELKHTGPAACLIAFLPRAVISPLSIPMPTTVIITASFYDAYYATTNAECQ